MNKIIIILGLVLLSTTNALAANLQTVDEAKQNNTKASNVPKKTSTEISSTEVDGGNNSLTQASKLNCVKCGGNHQLIIAGYGDPERRGTPGEGRGSGASR